MNIEDREIVVQLRQQLLQAQLGALDTHVSADCELEQPAGLLADGHYRGPDGFRQALAQLEKLWSHFSVETRSVLSEDGHVVVLSVLKACNRRNSRSWSMPLVEVWKLREHKVVKMKPFYWDTHALHLDM